MSTSSYDIGSLVTLTGTFALANGTLADPTTVTCTVRDPAGTVTTPSTSKTSTGVYTASVDLTSAEPGVWNYRFQGVGAVQAAEEATFYVEPSAV